MRCAGGAAGAMSPFAGSVTLLALVAQLNLELEEQCGLRPDRGDAVVLVHPRPYPGGSGVRAAVLAALSGAACRAG